VPLYSVSIAKQVHQCRVPRKRLDDLLAGPDRRGRIGHVEMNDPPVLVRQNKKDEQHTNSRCWNREEIHGDNILGVVRQECSPPLRRWLSVTNHVLRDSGLASLSLELEQLTVNPRSAPQGIIP